MTTPQLRLSSPTVPRRSAGRRARPADVGLLGVGGVVALAAASWLFLNPAEPASAQSGPARSGVVAAAHAVTTPASDVRGGSPAVLAGSVPPPTPAPLPLDATSRNPFLSPLAPPPPTADPGLPPGGGSGGSTGAGGTGAGGTDGDPSAGNGSPGTGSGGSDQNGGGTGDGTGSGNSGSGDGSSGSGTGDDAVEGKDSTGGKDGAGAKSDSGGTKCLAGNCDEK